MNPTRFASTLPKPHKPIQKANALSKSLQSQPKRRISKFFSHALKRKN
jgi:hypothetical protein